MWFHYTQHEKKIFPRSKRVIGELKQLPPRGSLPSLPLIPIIGREDPWLAGLGGSSSAVQRTVCHLKSAWGSSCQVTGTSCGSCSVLAVSCRAVSLLTVLSQHSWALKEIYRSDGQDTAHVDQTFKMLMFWVYFFPNCIGWSVLKKYYFCL